MQSLQDVPSLCALMMTNVDVVTVFNVLGHLWFHLTFITIH